MDLLTDNDPWAGGLITGRPIELKLISDATESGLVEGYASTFGGLDHGQDTVHPGAFADSLQAHHAAGTAPAMLWAHRHSEPVGRWDAMGEDARGLRVRG